MPVPSMGDRGVDPSARPPLRFLVIGGSFTNKGAEAMVLTTVEELSSRWPGCAITVASYSKEEDIRFGPHRDLDGMLGSFDYVRSGRSLWKPLRILLLGLPIGTSLRRRVCGRDDYLGTLAEVDAVLDVSGFAFSDQRPLIRCLVYCFEILSARWCGARFVAMTQAFGPFSGITRGLAKTFLPLADLIVARGEESRWRLADLGIDSIQCSDMAYLFRGLPREEGRRQLAAAGVPADRPAFGLVPNIHLYTRTPGEGTANTYLQGLAKLTVLADQLGATPIFVCHESYPSGHDDEWLARQAAIASGVARYEILDAHRPAAALKSVIGELSFVVASRFHSVVAAISTATPFLSIGWSHKYQELVVEAGERFAALDGRSTGGEEWCQRAVDLWKEREAMARRLREVGPQLEQSARRAFELLENRLDESSSH